MHKANKEGTYVEEDAALRELKDRVQALREAVDLAAAENRHLEMIEEHNERLDAVSAEYTGYKDFFRELK